MLIGCYIAKTVGNSLVVVYTLHVVLVMYECAHLNLSTALFLSPDLPLPGRLSNSATIFTMYIRSLCYERKLFSLGLL